MLILLICFSPHCAISAIVKSINISGLSKIEPSMVNSIIGDVVGKNILPHEMSELIKKIYRTNLFTQVEINVVNGILEIALIEGPMINEINFVGINSKVGDALKGELYNRSRGVYNKEKLKEDSEKIRAAFFRHGRVNFDINTRVNTLPDNRVDINFEITEGEEAIVSRINFIGNESFNNKRLSATLSTKGTDRILKFMKGKTFDDEMFEKDKSNLELFYKNQGFPNVVVNYAVADYKDSDNSIVITFSISEGPKATFGNLKISNNNENIDTNELYKGIKKVVSGALYQKRYLDIDKYNLNKYLANKGYLGAQIDVNEDFDEFNNTVNVEFVIQNSDKKYINRINILGTTRSNDYVIRRELLFVEGDLYNYSTFYRSKRKLEMLGFFEGVSINPTPINGSNNKVDVNVMVKDRTQTGSVNFSVGFSTFEQLVLSAGLTKDNLFGRGYHGGLNITASSLQRQIQLSLMDPHFLGSNIGLGFNVMFNNFDAIPLFGQNELIKLYASYKSNDVMAAFQTSYPIFEKLYHSIALQWRYNDTKSAYGVPTVDSSGAPVSSGSWQDSLVYRQQINNTFMTTSIRNSFRLDFRNAPILPTKGFQITLSQEVSMPLPEIDSINTPKYFSGDLSASWYIPLPIAGIVLNIAGKAGAISGYDNSAVPFQMRYALGYSSFRGFYFNSIGPKIKIALYDTIASDTPYVDSAGNTYEYVMPMTVRANYYYIATAELLIPPPFLPKEYNVRLLAFVDVGSAFGFNSSYINNTQNLYACTGENGTHYWCHTEQYVPPVVLPDRPGPKYVKESIVDDTPMPRVVAGIGVLWISPFGPLRLEAGFTILKQRYDTEAQIRIHFSPTPI